MLKFGYLNINGDFMLSAGQLHREDISPVFTAVRTAVSLRFIESQECLTSLIACHIQRLIMFNGLPRLAVLYTIYVLNRIHFMS